jgi:choline monooxygenase
MTSALRDAIDRGSALPSSWYTDPDIFRGETERILRRSWHFVTDATKLAAIGDQFVWEIAGVPILLVRDRADEIRGFVNICRHRGYPVVVDPANHSMLRCGYHGWSYDLDGSLRRAPRSESEPVFDTTGLCLLPVQVAVWGPMVWVNVDMAAPPFAEWTSGLPELMAERGCSPADYVLGFENVWEIPSNWKVFQDNTIECYHCPTAHPELSRALVMDPRTHDLAVGGRYWIHHRIPFRDGVEAGITYAPPPEGPWYYFYNWVFPTTYLQHSGRGFDVGTVQVLDVDRIRFRHLCFLPPDLDDATRAKGKRRLDADATIHQDVDICTRVQRSHAAEVAPPGTLLPQNEALLTHFYRLILDMMSGTETQEASARAHT